MQSHDFFVSNLGQSLKITEFQMLITFYINIFLKTNQ
jgi:hypothetical protein